MFRTKTMLFAALSLVAGIGLVSPGLSATASAADRPALEDEKPAKAAVAVGVIVSVDLENNTFTIKVKGEGDASKEVALQINEATKYMIGKEEAGRADVLVVDAKVRVKHAEGVALAVTRMGKPDAPKPE